MGCPGKRVGLVHFTGKLKLPQLHPVHLNPSSSRSFPVGQGKSPASDRHLESRLCLCFMVKLQDRLLQALPRAAVPPVVPQSLLCHPGPAQQHMGSFTALIPSQGEGEEEDGSPQKPPGIE